MAGFKVAMSHLSPAKQDRLLREYQVADARREKLISAFIRRIKGD
jgi:hypothetical protein